MNTPLQSIRVTESSLQSLIGREFSSWAEAEAAMRQGSIEWESYARDWGPTAKVWFTVTWKDGMSYRGVCNISLGLGQAVSILGSHLRGYSEIVAKRPVTGTATHQIAVMRAGPVDRDFHAKLLDSYDLGA